MHFLCSCFCIPKFPLLPLLLIHPPHIPSHPPHALLSTVSPQITSAVQGISS